MSEKRSIVMLLDGDFLGDIRVKREALALSNKFNVIVICSGLTNRNKDILHYEGADIIYVEKLNNKAKKFFYDTLVAITWIHPLFYEKASELIKNMNNVILHVHDLPLVGTANKLKENFEQVNFLVSDFHENYPEGLQAWNNRRKNPIIRLRNKLFFSQKRWTKYEMFAISKSDKVITVIEEMKYYLMEKHGVKADKLFIVPNSTSITFAENLIDSDLAADKHNQFNIVYVGGIGDHRGLDTLIKSLPKVKKQIPQLRFVVYGKGNKDIVDYLYNLIEDLDLKDTVEFNDWVPSDRIPALMKEAHINVIPHNSNKHTDHTMPNKIYQMLLVGQPILVSTCKPIKRIVEETGSGKIFKAGDETSCAEKIIEIYTDYELIIASKEKVIEFSKKNYSWEKSAKDLVDFYLKLT